MIICIYGISLFLKTSFEHNLSHQKFRPISNGDKPKFLIQFVPCLTLVLSRV